MKKDTIISLFLFLGYSGMYLVTGYGTVAPYRDSGDLAAAAYTLGISHPPGYVLYVLMGKLISVCLPWGETAYRLNFLSILFGALAIVFVYLILRRYTSNFAAVAGASCAGFIPALWGLSQVTEMYSINACFGAGILWWLLQEQDIRKTVCLGGLIAGIGLTNHQTLLFFFPGYVYIIWRKIKKSHEPFSPLLPVIGAGAGFFLIGLSLYVFLPLRSITEPLLDSGNPETIRNLWRMISRSDYGLLKLHPQESVLSWTAGGIWDHIVFFFSALKDQFTWIGIIAGIIGIWCSWKKNILSGFALLFIISGPGFVILANLPIQQATSLPILEPNLILPGLVWALWIGLGVSFLQEKNRSQLLGGIVLLVLLFGNSLVYSFGRGVYNRCNFLSYDFGKNIMRSMEPGSILYNPDDPTTFITEYFKMRHHYRADIRTIVYFRTLWGYERLKKLYPEIMPEGIQSTAQEFLSLFFKKNTGSIPICADLPVKFPDGMKSLPQGLVYRLADGKEKEPVSRQLEHSVLLLSLLPFRPYPRIQANDAFFSRQIFSYYTSAHNNTGIDLLDSGNYDAARKEYLKAVGMNPFFKEGWSNLGALEFKRNNFDAAEKYFRMVLAIDPRNAEGWYHVGLTLKRAKKDEDALSAFTHVPETGTYGAYMLNEKGLLYLGQKEYDTAITDFRSAIRIMPSYTLPYYNLGLAYQSKGLIPEAVAAYQEYSRLTPDPAEKKEVEQLLRQLSRR